MTPDHYQRIYAHDAGRYERLIAREDQRGNIFSTLMDLHPFSGATVAEFGAGTGRLTRILSVVAQHIYAFDGSPAMLHEGQRVLIETGMVNWSLTQADNRTLPLATNSVDCALEGWSFGHGRVWYAPDWQPQLDRMLGEMQRVVKPNGSAILIETMSVGKRQPEPPSPELAELYAYFENEHGFDYRWTRTDFQFESVAEADELIRFFFGDVAADKWVAGKNIIIPACTGFWSKTV